MVDTNILFSGILFEGLESDLLDLGYQGKIDLHISEYVLDEITQVFKRKSLPVDLLKKYIEYSKITVVTENKIINHKKFNHYHKQAKELIHDIDDRPVFILAKIMIDQDHNVFFITGDKGFHKEKVKKSLNNKVLRTQEVMKKLVNDI